MSEPVQGREQMEELICSVIASAKAGNVSDHRKNSVSESWVITNGPDKYLVENVSRRAKTDRAFNKANFYKINPDGSLRCVNLGKWKKKKFYTLLYCLMKDKVFHKIDTDPVKVRTIAAEIKSHPENWNVTSESIKGSLDGKTVEVKRRRVQYPSGKCLYRAGLFENGELILKGSQLMKLWK